MTWVLILLIAAIVFVLLAFVLKMPRAGWELSGAALLVGIAGYALQGHPGTPGAPKAPIENKRAADEALVKQRQQMGDQFAQGQSWMILADGLARQGQYGAAAEVLRKGTQQFPRMLTCGFRSVTPWSATVMGSSRRRRNSRSRRRRRLRRIIPVPRSSWVWHSPSPAG